MKKILVTGGAGYIGSTLVPMLLQEGYEVSIIDNLLYENNHSFFLTPVDGTTLLRHPNFKKFVKGDIRNVEQIKEALENQDYIIHLAAIVGAPACNKNPELAKTTHIDGTRNILNNMTSNQKLIFASTGSNYGKVDGICYEDTPLNPLTLYGKTKTEAEATVTGKVIDAKGAAHAAQIIEERTAAQNATATTCFFLAPILCKIRVIFIKTARPLPYIS